MRRRDDIEAVLARYRTKAAPVGEETADDAAEARFPFKPTAGSAGATRPP